MSTEIGIIEGKKEVLFLDRIAYIDSKLQLTRFSGGKEGIMLQLSIEKDFIQLNGNQVNELKKVLNNWETLNEINI